MIRKTDEDLFKETTMTFGEHLEELRICLFKAILGLVVGFLIGLGVANWVVEWMQRPLVKALGDFYSNGALDKYKAWAVRQVANKKPLPYPVEQVENLIYKQEQIPEMIFVHRPAVDASLDLGGKDAPSRPAKSTKSDKPAKASDDTPSALGLDAKDLVPLFLWRPISDDPRIRVTSLSVQETFGIWVKAALLVGAVISSPWIFLQIWNFIAAGLYRHERHYVVVFLPFSVGLFLAGVAAAFLFVFAPVLNFLFSFNKTMGIDPDPRISEWLGFVLLLPLGFGISFQLPLVMLFLERIGIFSIESYLSKWRVSVLVIFVVSMILTPADPVSMLVMAVPLTFLYFGGVLMCKYMPKNKSPYADAPL